MSFGWYPFQVVHLKEAATHLNGLNGRKNGEELHLELHLELRFFCYKNETYQEELHLELHFGLFFYRFVYLFSINRICFCLFLNYLRE